MLNIKVLGPGCANCERVAQMVAATLEELESFTPPADFTP